MARLIWDGYDGIFDLWDGTRHTGISIETDGETWEVVSRGRYVQKTGIAKLAEARVWAEEYYRGMKAVVVAPLYGANGEGI